MKGKERVQVTNHIEDTLDEYCRNCPYLYQFNHRNCKKCPVAGLLQEYGRELGWGEDSNKPKGHNRWSIEEQDILERYHGKIQVREIAKKLGRSESSVRKRIVRMREKENQLILE